MINGMEANLVNKPRIKKTEQKNSANTSNANSVLAPIPNHALKCHWASKHIIKMCEFVVTNFNHHAPTTILNNSIAKLNAPAE